MKTLKHFTKKAILTLIAITSLSMVACGKKGGDPAPGNVVAAPPPTDPNAVCNGCSGNQQPLLVGVQASHSMISMGLDFWGDPNLGINFSDPKAITVYRGPLVIQGNAVVRNLCGANGNYTIRTANQGSIIWAAISGAAPVQSGSVAFSFPSSRMTLEAIPTSGGGPNIIILVAFGEIYNASMSGVSGLSQTNRVGLNMGVVVGGQPCQDISTY